MKTLKTYLNYIKQPAGFFRIFCARGGGYVSLHAMKIQSQRKLAWFGKLMVLSLLLLASDKAFASDLSGDNRFLTISVKTDEYSSKTQNPLNVYNVREAYKSIINDIKQENRSDLKSYQDIENEVLRQAYNRFKDNVEKGMLSSVIGTSIDGLEFYYNDGLFNVPDANTSIDLQVCNAVPSITMTITIVGANHGLKGKLKRGYKQLICNEKQGRGGTDSASQDGSPESPSSSDSQDGSPESPSSSDSQDGNPLVGMLQRGFFVVLLGIIFGTAYYNLNWESIKHVFRSPSA